MSDMLMLEESLVKELTHIEEEHEWVELSNQLGSKVDAEELIDCLQQIEGIDRIETLTIDYNSSLHDLRVLRAFPNLKGLFVYGQNIKNLDGIEWFSKGEFIKIQTHRNRRRDISQLAQTKVEKIILFVERVEDLSVVAGCRNLEAVDISCSMEPDFAEWKEISAETISFKSCKFKYLGNISIAERVKKLNVQGCRSLERFTGDNSNIQRLLVDSCNKLDLGTLRTFKGVEVLTVNSCKKEINLTELRGLEHLKHISFILCNVEVDLINLKEYFPSLESCYISKMKKDYGIQLKQLNPDVQIKSEYFQL